MIGIHRDIKPANIFIRRGEIMIGDFGMSLILPSNAQNSIIHNSTVTGTLRYSSPQVLFNLHSIQ